MNAITPTIIKLYDIHDAEKYINQHIKINTSLESEILDYMAINYTRALTLNDLNSCFEALFTNSDEVKKSIEFLVENYFIFKMQHNKNSYMINHVFVPTFLLNFAHKKSNQFSKACKSYKGNNQLKLSEVIIYSILGLKLDSNMVQALQYLQQRHGNIKFNYSLPINTLENQILLYKLFKLPKATDILSNLSNQTLELVFINGVYLPTKQGLPCQELLKYFEDTILNKKLASKELLNLYFSVLFFKGQFSEIDRISIAYNVIFLKWSSLKHYLSGDIEAAINDFKKTINTIKNNSFSGYRMEDIFDAIMMIVWVLGTDKLGYKNILNLARQDTNEFFYQLCCLDEFKTKGVSNNNTIFKIERQNLDLNSHFETSLQEESPCQNHFSFHWDDVETLFELLILFWFSRPKLDNLKSAIEKRFSIHLNNQNNWIAFEYGSLLLEIDPENQLKNEISALSKLFTMQPIYKIYKDTSIWEKKLELLMLIGGKKKSPVKEKRLIWLFNYERSRIEPIIQINAKDGWQSSSNSPYRASLDASVNYISDLDRALLSPFQYHLSMYGADTPFGKIMLSLIAHPLVFNDKHERVEITNANIYLQITEQHNAYKIEFSSLINEDSDLYINKLSNTHFEVCSISQKIKRIFQIIGKNGLVIPIEAKDSMIKTLQSISSEIIILSNIESVSIHCTNTVEGSCEILLRLYPFQAGLALELFISPFSSKENKTINDFILVRPGIGNKQLIDDSGKEKTIVLRELNKEKEALESLLQAIPSLQTTQDQFCHWSFPNPEDALEFMESLKSLDNQYRIEWPKGETFKINGQANAQKFNLSVNNSGDWFELNGDITFDDGTVYSLKKILSLLEINKSRFIALSNKNYLSISKELKKKLDDISWLTHSKNDQILASKLTLTALENTFNGINLIDTNKNWQQIIKSAQKAKKHAPQYPSTLQTTLRPYQIEGFEWLSRLAAWGVGACLADDMGLGKTVQSIASLLERALLGPALIVAPVSVGDNWLNEINKFAPTLIPHLLRNQKTKDSDLAEWCQPFHVIICSYGLMHQRIEALSEITFSTIIIDEAQAIKNFHTKRFEAAIKLKGDFKILTTGTPIENHLMELWSLFFFLNPGLLGTKNQFMEKFFNPIHKNKDPDAQNYLKQIIQPFVLRRLKKNVLTELPEKIEINRYVEMSEQEISFYESIRQLGIEKIESATERGEHQALQVLAEITKLRRACCHANLIAPELKIPSAKMAEFDVILDELLENKHKALVFSQFVGFLKIIEEHVKNRNIPYQYLDGSTPAAKRQEIVNNFQAGQGELFLISLKAGGTGLNLTAANFVIHMDPWWNPAVEDQATDRTHRIGQKQPVTVYRIVTKGTIEEKILKLHNDKRDLADSVLAGSEGIGKLNSNDLFALLKENLNLQ